MSAVVFVDAVGGVARGVERADVLEGHRRPTDEVGPLVGMFSRFFANVAGGRVAVPPSIFLAPFSSASVSFSSRLCTSPPKGPKSN